MLKRIILFASITATSYLGAEPIPLTEKTLDSISAGTVELTVHAAAQGEGHRAKNIAIANINIEEQPVDENGNIFTVSTGTALAFSRGEQVSTEVGYAATVTDEKIVSFTVEQSISSGAASKPKQKNKKGKQKQNKTERNRAKKRNKSRGRPIVINEKQTLSVTIVTVQSN